MVDLEELGQKIVEQEIARQTAADALLTALLNSAKAEQALSEETARILAHTPPADLGANEQARNAKAFEAVSVKNAVQMLLAGTGRNPRHNHLDPEVQKWIIEHGFQHGAGQPSAVNSR